MRTQSPWLRSAVLMGAAIALSLSLGDNARAEDEEAGTVREILEVKRAKQKGPKHSSLQFLRDNRAFLRAQLDALRLEFRTERDDDAQMIDERWLRLAEMSAAIAAARGTVGHEFDVVQRREFLQRVGELDDLEEQLGLMESLLGEQRGRLLALEQDFLGQQQTALVILVRGASPKSAPDALLLREEGESIHLALSIEQQTALAQGGVAQIYHEFVEPREHLFELSLQGASFADAAPGGVTVETPRNRLTFVELDLASLDQPQPAGGLSARVWQR